MEMSGSFLLLGCAAVCGAVVLGQPRVRPLDRSHSTAVPTRPPPQNYCQAPARPASPLSHSNDPRDQETPGAGCEGGQHQPQRSWQPLCSQSSSQRSGPDPVPPTGLGDSGGCRHWQHLLGDPKARAQHQCLELQLTVPPVLCPDLSQEHCWVHYSLPGCGKELLERFSAQHWKF